MSGGSILNYSGELIGIHGRAEVAYRSDEGKLIASGTNQGVPINFYNLFSGLQNTVVTKSKSSRIENLIAKSSSVFMVKGKEKEFIRIIDEILQEVETSEVNVSEKYIAQAYYLRGYHKSESGDLKAAILDLDKSIEIVNNDEISFVIRGVIKSFLKDEYVAITDFNKAIALNPNTEAYTNRGNSLNATGNYFEAINDFNKAIELSLFSINKKHLEKTYFNRAYAKHGVKILKGQ